MYEIPTWPPEKVEKPFVFLYMKLEERNFVQKIQLRMASWKGEQESKSYFSKQYYLPWAKVKSGFPSEPGGGYLRINVQGININGNGG